jgi:hypothetical protein
MPEEEVEEEEEEEEEEETWSRTLSEEYRVRVLESRVLRVIFGPKCVEVTREWRRLHNKEV